MCANTRPPPGGCLNNRCGSQGKIHTGGNIGGIGDVIMPFINAGGTQQNILPNGNVVAG